MTPSARPRKSASWCLVWWSKGLDKQHGSLALIVTLKKGSESLKLLNITHDLCYVGVCVCVRAAFVPSLIHCFAAARQHSSPAGWSCFGFFLSSFLSRPQSATRSTETLEWKTRLPLKALGGFFFSQRDFALDKKSFWSFFRWQATCKAVSTLRLSWPASPRLPPPIIPCSENHSWWFLATSRTSCLNKCHLSRC